MNTRPQVMTNPQTATPSKWKRFPQSKVGRVVLPLVVLAIFYVAIFSKYGVFGTRGPARPR